MGRPTGAHAAGLFFLITDGWAEMKVIAKIHWVRKIKTADEWSEIKIRSATEEKEELVVDRESRTEK